MDSAPADRWRRLAARTARRVNFAWWLQSFAPAAAVAGAGVFATVYIWRTKTDALPVGAAAAGIGGVYALLGLGAWMAARRKFSTVTDALTRLESRLKLNNALSAAAAGITAWPAPPETADDGVRFRPAWIAAPAAFTAGCLLLAFLMPVPTQADTPPVAPPLAWDQVESMISTLEREEVAKKEDLEKLREQLEDLRERPQEDWYSHENLEAADTMKESVRQAAANLGQNLEQAATAAEGLEKFDSQLSEADRKQLEGGLQSALSAMNNSGLAPNEKLMNQLRQMDPGKLKNLSGEQIRRMAENLKKKAGACKQCAGGGKSDAQKELEKLLGDCEGNGSGDGEGDEPGSGGVSRGPGTTALTYGDETDAETSRMEALESQNLADALPGDTLQTSNVEHNPDQTPRGPAAGGAVASPGQGGDAVWRESLLPSEKQVLRKVFK